MNDVIIPPAYTIEELIENTQTLGNIAAPWLNSISDFEDAAKRLKIQSNNREFIFFTNQQQFFGIKNALEKLNASYEIEDGLYGRYAKEYPEILPFVFDCSFHINGVTFHVIKRYDLDVSVIVPSEFNRENPEYRACMLIQDL